MIRYPACGVNNSLSRLTLCFPARYAPEKRSEDLERGWAYRSGNQSGNRWGSRSIIGSVSSSWGELVSESLNESTSELTSRSMSELVTESASESVIQLLSESWG